MSIRPFTFDSLATFDGGRVARAWDKLMQDAIDHCRDVPSNTSSRKVTLTMEICPVEDHTGDLDAVEIQHTLKSSLPGRKSQTWTVGLKKDGKPYYSEGAPDNPDQRTFPTMDEPAADGQQGEGAT